MPTSVTINSSSKILQEGLTTTLRSNPIQGITAITAYSDDSASSSGSASWSKTFRYTTNGVIYTDYITFTTAALEALVFDVKDIVIIELVFTANQPPGANFLTVSEFQMTGSVPAPTSSAYNTYNYDNSIFSNYFTSNDTTVLQWQVAVLNKLYENGIVPSYIQRSTLDDYFAFWSAVTKFFAFYVTYARVFRTFETYLDILTEFLTQKGLSISIDDSLGDLQLLMTSFNTQMMHRGTAKIIEKEETGANVDGELIRTIFYIPESDEFLFNPYRSEHFGWNVGNSSPLYRGLFLNDNINKYPNQSFAISDLSKINFSLNPGNATIITDPDVSFKVMNIVTPCTIQGPGDPLIKISSLLDYEVTFIIKTEDSAGSKITFGIDAYDIDESPINCSSSQDGSASNLFFQGCIICTYNHFAVVRGVIYNQAMSPSSSHVTQTHQGNDLIFNPDTVWITPIIAFENGVKIHVYGIRIVPLTTPYSRGFVQVKNFISCWLVNHNKQFTLVGLQEYIKRYLIPYNSVIKLTSVDPSDVGVNLLNPVEHIFSSGEDLDSFSSSYLVGQYVAIAVDGYIQCSDQYTFDNATGTIYPTVPFEIGQRIVVMIISAAPINYIVTGSGDTTSATVLELINQNFVYSVDGLVQSTDEFTFNNTTGVLTPNTPWVADQRLTVFLVKNLVTSNPIEYQVTGTGDTLNYTNLLLIGQQLSYSQDGLVQCSLDQYAVNKILGRITPTLPFATSQKLVTFIL